MFIAKLKFAAVVALTIVTLGLGTGYVTHQALANAEVRESQPLISAPGNIDSSDFVAQRGERKQLPSVSGFVKSANAGKINILVSRDNPDGETYELVKDVKVVLIEGRETKDAKLADVQPRTRVTLILDDAKKVVQSIQIIGARAPDAGGRGDDTIFRGQVTELDTTKHTISFMSGGRGEPETTKTFALAKDVKVTRRTGRSSKEGKLSDVILKTYVQVKLDETKKIVQAIDIAISTGAYGSVSKIDADSITLVAGRGPEGKRQTFALAKDVKVQFRFPGRGPDRAPGKVKEGKLADVMVNALVSVQLDDERKVVQAIDIAVSTTAHGSVSEIDDKSITLVSGRDPELKSEAYALAKDVKVQYRLPMPREGAVKTIKLADVTVKSYVSLQLDDERKTVQSIDIQLPSVRGTVQEIDAKKGTLVIRGPRENDLSVSLAKDLRVIVNGKAGKLSEIAVGAEVAVILSPDRMQALVIATPFHDGRREE